MSTPPQCILDRKLFTTLRQLHGLGLPVQLPVFWDWHLQRLSQSCEANAQPVCELAKESCSTIDAHARRVRWFRRYGFRWSAHILKDEMLLETLTRLRDKETLITFMFCLYRISAPRMKRQARFAVTLSPEE